FAAEQRANSSTGQSEQMAGALVEIEDKDIAQHAADRSRLDLISLWRRASAAEMRVRPVELIRRLAVIAARVRLHDTRVHRKPLALDEAIRHARRDHALEDVAQDVALAKALKTIDRKRGVMRDLVVEIELAEPPIGKVQLDLLAQTTLMSDAVAVSDNQHPDHEFRIDRRAADVAVKGSQLMV